MERNGTYLLCRRHRNGELPGKWEFPGGKIEAGENEEACLVREIREELALEAVPRRRLGEVEQELPAGRLTLIAYCAGLSEGEPRILEHDEIAWVAAEDLLSFDLAPADVDIARWIAAGACKD